MIDAFSETLRLAHLVGEIAVDARLTAPWCYQAPRAASHASKLEAGAEHVVAFHMVNAGECYVEMDDDSPLLVGPGELVLFPHGDAYRLTSEPGAVPDRSGGWTEASARRPHQLYFGGGGLETKLIGGYLACDASLGRMLLGGLPRVVHVNLRGSSAGAWVEASVRYTLRDAHTSPGAESVLGRLAEVLFIEALRIYMSDRHDAGSGWFAAIRDRIVGAALASLHKKPAHPWTLEELARAVGTSRTVLAQRFQSLVGKPVMQYLTQWRMQLAANLLRHSTLPLTRIAEDVGYETYTAFIRAFRREFGAPPATWRRTQSRRRKAGRAQHRADDESATDECAPDRVRAA